MKSALKTVGVASLAAFLLWAVPRLVDFAKAGVACSVPFTFVNGTTADATQVNSNFSSVVNCLANAASAGVNSDITQLAGLTTPLPPNEGGSWVYVATATSTGTANAQVIAATSPTGFSLTLGKKVIFVSGFSNTAATTINVAGTGVLNFFRPTPSGPVAMVGGEIVTGQLVEAVYDGTEYQMTSDLALPYGPGTVFDYAGSAGCPVGSASALGGNLATATFPTLSAVLGVSWGNPGGGNFTLPDLRGRTTFGLDNGAARITVAGGNFDGTVFANTGGQQNQTLTQAQLPSYTLPTGTAAAQTINCPNNNACSGISSSSTLIGVTASGGSNTYLGTSFQTIQSNASNVTITSGGSGNSHPVLSNGAVVLKCVKE